MFKTRENIAFEDAPFFLKEMYFERIHCPLAVHLSKKTLENVNVLYFLKFSG